MKTRSVYVIGSATNGVKVGIANYPRDRLSSLQVGSPIPLTLEYAGECDDPAAQNIERVAHLILQKHHSHGEWFAVSVEDAIDAITRAAENLGYSLVQVDVTPEAPRGPKQGRIFQMRLSEEFLAKVDDWRRVQPIFPSRTEAIRQLVEWAIEQQARRR